MKEKLKQRKTSNANEKQSLISKQSLLSLFWSSNVQPAFLLLYMLITMSYIMGQPFASEGQLPWLCLLRFLCTPSLLAGRNHEAGAENP